MKRTRANGNGDSRNSVGRPSPYHVPQSKYEIAYYLTLLGATDEDLADAFDVSVTTVNNWKKDHPEFLESIKRGKKVADAKVAASLYQRAVGYSHPEDKFNVVDKELVITPTTKHYPPDVTACIFWLKNRQKDKWRDVHRVEGKFDHDHRHAVLDLSTLSREELIMARRLGIAQEEKKRISDDNSSDSS